MNIGLAKQSKATLRAVLKIGNASLHELEESVGDIARNAIRSLYRLEYVQVVDTRSQRTKQGCTKEMNVYAITDKGRQKLQDIDFPKAAEMKAAKACKLGTALYEMQHFITPIRNPNVNEMYAEIGGRKVKITYGVHHEYSPYVPPRDDGTRYQPRRFKSILASD